MLCYDETPMRSANAVPFDPMRVNAVKKYLGHYANYLYLTFMLANGTMQERHQASKELTICERKMKYWQKQPHFIDSEAHDGIAKLRRQWA